MLVCMRLMRVECGDDASDGEDDAGCAGRRLGEGPSRPTKSQAFRVRLTHFGPLSRSHAQGTKSHA